MTGGGWLFSFRGRPATRWWFETLERPTPAGSVKTTGDATEYVRALEAAVQAAHDLVSNGLLNDCPHKFARGECITCTFKAALGQFNWDAT